MIMRARSALVMLWAVSARAEPSAAALAWSRVRVPSEGPAQAIGGYSAGCVRGAVALPAAGAGFAVAKPERHRVFGHPVLVGLIVDLGRRLKERHLPDLSVGDLGQARGGPAPTGHASHQNGLDADLWFLPPVGDDAVSMVDAEHQRPSPRFDEAKIVVLALAAADPRVDRIFIHPVLKRALCQRARDDRAWLHKLAPWWGHEDHFHVRLACPPGSPACVAPPPLPPGDGCDQLGWWFDTAAQAERQKARKKYAARVGAAPELPPACRALLETN